MNQSSMKPGALPVGSGAGLGGYAKLLLRQIVRPPDKVALGCDPFSSVEIGAVVGPGQWDESGEKAEVVASPILDARTPFGAVGLGEFREFRSFGDGVSGTTEFRGQPTQFLNSATNARACWQGCNASSRVGSGPSHERRQRRRG